MRFFLNAILLLFAVTGHVYAQELVHALSMHGAPKYGADFTHLDYTSPEAKKGGKIVRSALGTFDTLNDFNIKGKKAEGLELLYDPLMQRVWDEPFSLYGLIAEKVLLSEDRSEITYFLNPVARFHDGTKVSADDVIFSFEQHKAHGKPVTRQVYGLVKDYQKIDAHQVKFTFGEGYDAESAMILSIMRIVPKHYWQDKDFGETTLEPPLGSGPYKIASLDPGRSITYSRVKDYWAADLPVNRHQFNFDEIIYDYYRDETVAFEAFKSGAIDLWKEQDISRWLSGYEEGRGYIQKRFEHGRPEWLRAIIFNTRKDDLADSAVRQALALAFPAEWVNNTLFHGQLSRIRSVFPNSELAKPRPEIMPVPERARLRHAADLLKAQGWVVEDGALQKDGKALALEVLLNNPEDEKIALAYARSLEKIGVKLAVRSVDSAQFLGRLNDFDYDLVFYRWINSLSPGNEQYIYWGSAAADQRGTRNYAGVNDPAVNAAIDDLVHAKSREDLISEAHKLDQLIMAGTYFIPLYYKGADFYALGQAIKSPEITPVYGPVIETWWAKGNAQ